VINCSYSLSLTFSHCCCHCLVAFWQLCVCVSLSLS